MGVVHKTQKKYLNSSKQETWFEKLVVYLYMKIDMKLFQWSLCYKLKDDDNIQCGHLFCKNRYYMHIC